jgi:glycosyltransferase involved in cell wall biosynthesis
MAAVAAANRSGAGLTLRIIGEKPPETVLAEKFVKWCGWLDPWNPTDRGKFSEILSSAGLELLLCRNDVSPLAIPEASMHGVATLATDGGAIGEMIRHGRTGWVVPADADAAPIGKLLSEMFEDPDRMSEAGTAAHVFQQERWNWRAGAARCLEGMVPAVAGN